MLSYADANIAGKAADRRSAHGGVVICREGAVCWGFQNAGVCDALNGRDAEYVAIDMVKEILFSRQVWRYMTA